MVRPWGSWSLGLAKGRISDSVGLKGIWNVLSLALGLIFSVWKGALQQQQTKKNTVFGIQWSVSWEPLHSDLNTHVHAVICACTLPLFMLSNLMKTLGSCWSWMDQQATRHQPPLPNATSHPHFTLHEHAALIDACQAMLSHLMWMSQPWYNHTFKHMWSPGWTSYQPRANKPSSCKVISTCASSIHLQIYFEPTESCSCEEFCQQDSDANVQHLSSPDPAFQPDADFWRFKDQQSAHHPCQMQNHLHSWTHLHTIHHISLLARLCFLALVESWYLMWTFDVLDGPAINPEPTTFTPWKATSTSRFPSPKLLQNWLKVISKVVAPITLKLKTWQA